MRCRDCGYSLDGLSLRSRCPECGSSERDYEDEQEIRERLKSKVHQSIWVPPALACVTIALGLGHPLLAPLVGLFAIMFVGVIAEDVTRLRGFLHPEWSPARWLAALILMLALHGIYFMGLSMLFWKVANSALVRSFL